ncbi:MAG: SpoIIE family protein phosphatase [Candidatus Riflebacteria bacterium]|nr:SpoIIE family protein phosphatase [Candidatus Riflebacteria bacterium]
MDVRTRWLGLALTIWGIPAFLFWCGVGVFGNLDVRRQVEDRFARLEDTLERAVVELHDLSWLDRRLRQVWAPATAGTTPVASAAAILGALEDCCPAGMVQAFLFDGTGRLVLPRRRGHAQAVQPLFDFVRRPWEEEFSDFRRHLQAADVLLEDAVQLACQLRGRPSRLVRTADPEVFPNRPSQALYSWRAGLSPDVLAGCLILVRVDRGPGSFTLAQSFAACATEGVQLGLAFPDGRVDVQAPLTPAAARRLASRYRTRPADRFPDGPSLVACSPLPNGALLIARTDQPAGSLPGLGWLLTAYGLGSLLVLRHLFRILAGVTAFRATLLVKMAMLFVFGVALPACFSGSLALLYLREKNDDLFERHRQAAFTRLDLVDAGFERTLAARERLYQRMLGHLEGHPVTPGQVFRALDRLWERLKVEAFFVISPDGVLVKKDRMVRDPDYVQMLQLPPDRRRQVLAGLLEAGRVPNPIEVDGLTGRLTLAEVGRLVPRGDGKMFQNLDRLLESMGRDIIEYANASRGLPAVPARPRPKVELGAVAGESVEGFTLTVRANLGRIMASERAIGSGYLYCQTVQAPDGRAIALVVINHTLCCLQYEYLDRLFAAHPPVPGGRRLSVITDTGPWTRHFPAVDEWRRYPSLMRDFGLTDATDLTRRLTVDGVELLVTARRGVRLRRCLLVEATPVAVVGRGLAPYRRRMAVFLLASVGFSLGLGFLLIRQVLVSLQDLSRGVQALRRKEFTHRVLVRRRDELGIMCDALNRTIAHLANMETAAVIQQNLLPAPDLRAGGFALHAFNLMTQAIGGDYFDFLPLPDGKVAVVLGDVSGHGVSAALVTAMAKAAFTLLCPLFPDQPVEVLRRVNDQFLAVLNRRKMMTCCLVVLDPVARRALLGNAGQCTPLQVTGGGKVEEISLGSSPLGTVKRARYPTAEADLATGGLILYSDGVVEAANDRQEMVGYTRFQEFAAAAWQGNPPLPSLVGEVLAKVRSFTGAVPWADDATVVVIRAE